MTTLLHRKSLGNAELVLFWDVVSDSIEEAVELVTTREEAEGIVQAWDRDEPDWRGILRVEKIEFTTGTAN
jgi:hypothetical protein